MVAFVMALGAGLMTGLSRFLDPWIVLVALAVSGALLRRRSAVVLIAAAGAGVLMAVVAAGAEAGRCAARLPAGTGTLRVRLVDPGLDGAPRAGIEGDACTGWISLRLDAPKDWPAGTRLEVSGRWIPRPVRFGRAAGTFVVRGHRVVERRPGATELLRSALTRASADLYGQRAPMVDALILGRRAALDPDLREDFARAGLVHLQAISGFHVGLLVSWTVLLARALGARRERAYLLGAGVAVGYVAFLGWPAPATRAAILGVLVAIGVRRQRSVRPQATLATAALVVILVDPYAVFDLGAWLSVSAVAGLALATRWSDRALGRTWAWRMLAASVGSTLATAPLTAGVLGAVAPIGIVLNFAAIPLAMLAVPGVLASLLASMVAPPLAEALAAGAGLALAALEVLAREGARIPGGHMVLEPGLPAALGWAAVAATAAWGAAGGSTAGVALRRWLAVAATASWAVAAGSVRPRAAADGRGTLTLHFLDVGQGDAAVVQTPAGRWVLVDAGPADRRLDMGRRVVAPYLARHGVRRLDAVLVSHVHADHLGGVGSVLRRVPAGLVIEPAMPAHDAGYAAFLDGLAASGTSWRAGRRGDAFTLDGVRFEILHPDTAWGWWGLDLNENSLVVRLRWAGFTALLTGDAGLPAEALLAGEVGDVDLLKVGHHGSRGSTGADFLALVRPELAVISAGRNNRHGHPAPEVLERLAQAGAVVRRTDRDGTIRVTISPGRMRIRSTAGDTTLSLSP